MPSSTSSSERRSGPDHLGRLPLRVVAAAAALALIMLVSSEATWRHAGHRPSVSDTDEAWAIQRSRVDGDPRAIAILGDSRTQLAFALDTMEARFPGRPIAQLAIVGRPPLAALVDLADDPEFNGTVLLGLHAAHLESTYMLDAPEPRVVAYHAKWKPATNWFYHDAWLRARIDMFLQERLVLLAPGLGLDRLARSLLQTGGLPPPSHIVQGANRQVAGDYRIVDADLRRKQFEALAEHRANRGLPNRVDWDRRARAVRDSIREIAARGGTVVLIRLPSSPDRFVSEERLHPRVEYWDRLADGTPAATVHYRDVPRLAELVPPDSSHLDSRDAERFTNALIDEIQRQGVLVE